MTMTKVGPMCGGPAAPNHQQDACAEPMPIAEFEINQGEPIFESYALHKVYKSMK